VYSETQLCTRRSWRRVGEMGGGGERGKVAHILYRVAKLLSSEQYSSNSETVISTPTGVWSDSVHSPTNLYHAYTPTYNFSISYLSIGCGT
jgi:hypothetical protein